MIIGVVAVDKNWGIGRTNKDTGKGELLFKLKKDMEFFKNTTMDSIVFLGWNTLLSFPGSKPLKNRSTICLCPEDINRDDCFCIHSFEDAVKLVKELSKTKDVFVIGGAMLYESMLPYYDEILVTKVKANGEGTVFFPNLDENSNFELLGCSRAVEDNGYTLNFCIYRKKEINE